MQKDNDNFIKKKILIYGLGKSGLASYKFLKEKNQVYVYDDNIKLIENYKIKKKIYNIKKIIRNNFDYIVVSPGINIKKCSLRNYIKKNSNKIITDLDIFYSENSKNKNITITGTNGKSTCVQILYEILKEHKYDVRLVGNIGHPILAEKKITGKTVFVIEASSYQIEYSNLFKTNYAAILNITPDHLDRHKTMTNYVKSKFKLILNQKKGDIAFLDIENNYLKKQIKKNKICSDIKHVVSSLPRKFIKKIINPYFFTAGNKQNLAFILEIVKRLKLDSNKVFKIINNFKGLKYRQQTIFDSQNIKIINDSKATSFASSINILKSLENAYWIVGGIPKYADKFFLTKKECLKFRAYIFGKNKNFFSEQFKNKINYKCSKDIKDAFDTIITDIKSTKLKKKYTILFSPAAASFDSFKNFEDRGNYFDSLIKKVSIKDNFNELW